MRLLLYDMGTYTQTDIMDRLDKMQIEYRNILYKLQDLSEDAYFEKRVRELLEREVYDAIFSVNYYPVLARLSREAGLPYLSWTYDSPLNIENLEETLGFETNYVFFFDRAECEKYWKKGYENIYHLPLAVNTDRLDAVQISKEDTAKYGADVSMVGQLYESVLPILLMPLADYDKGYIEAVLETQLKLYGSYILPHVLDEKLIERMNASYAALGQENLKLDREGFVITVAKHVTHLERVVLLDCLSENHKVNLYGPATEESLQKVNWMGSASYFEEMPKVFKNSRINLNVSLKCIQSGIPLRVLDILGCGGFLLTNYQPEIAEYFTDGEEVVMYTSLEDAVAKCAYYLEHEEERQQITQRGYQKVKELFGYENRLRAMFEVAGLS